MLLSNVAIHKALDEGRLSINPEPLPRKPAVGKHCPYDTHSVDLQLAAELVIPDLDIPYAYDLSQRKGLSRFLARNSRKETISKDKPYKLDRNQFILGKTIEYIDLPISRVPQIPSLAARIEGKSSRARIGLLVHFTAPTVHPGFSGTLTLEMINLGPAPILLQPEVPIAQLIIEEVSGIPVDNPSQFQGQTAPEGSES